MLKSKGLYLLLSLCFLASCTKAKKYASSNITPDSTLCTVGAQEGPSTSSQKATYQEGIELLNKKKYKKAAEKFANIYYEEPGGQITPYAELMEAYSYYLQEDYKDCIDILDNFILLHPVHYKIEWAYYLRANAAFEHIHDIYYDQNDTLDAKNFLQEVLERFPHSKYRDDIRTKLSTIDDYLNAREMYIGKYYMMGRNNPIAAINRFLPIASTDSPHQGEALFRLYEATRSLGLKDEASYYANRLTNKFPDSTWAQKARIKPNLKDDT